MVAGANLPSVGAIDFFLPEQDPAVQGNESQSAFQASKILITGKQKADL